MKKLIAVGFLSCFMLLGVMSLSHAFEQTSVQSELKIYKPEMAFINDACTPDVSPVYGNCIFVHSENVKLSEFTSEITPIANSPPYSNGITGV